MFLAGGVGIFYVVAHRARATHGARGTWATWLAFSVGGSLLARWLGGPAWYFLPTLLWVATSLGIVALAAGLWRRAGEGDAEPSIGRALATGGAGVLLGAIAFVALVAAFIACCFNLAR